MIRALALIGALALGGCDLALGIYAAGRSSDDDGDSAPAPVPPPPAPDLTYHVWIASVVDPAAEEADLVARSGDPDPAVWTEVGSAQTTTLFDPTAPAASFNAILVQAGEDRIQHVDAVEVLGATGHTVIAAAAAPVYSNLFLSPTAAVGTPDGITADSAATPSEQSFLFFVFGVPIERFRVHAWGPARGSGDVEWVATRVDASDETAGGAAVTSSGELIAAVDDDAGGGSRSMVLARYDAAGTELSPIAVTSGVTATAGGPSVAVHDDDTVYVATPQGAGDILVRRYTAGFAGVSWTVVYDSGVGQDRAEANGIAVDGAGNAIVVGGTATVTNGIDPWMRKFGAATGGTMWTQVPPLLPADTADTWWHGAATDGAGDVLSTGDLTSTASGFVEVVTRRSQAATGDATWADLFGDNTSPADLGRSIGVDAGGNVYTGGFVGTTGQGRNGVLLKYLPGGFLTLFITFDDQNALHDEILDIAVEPDGTVYAAGYETVAGQGENMFLRKYDPTGAVAWTRVYDGGFGDDRGAAVAVTATSVILVGTRTDSGGETDIHVRKHVK